MRPGACTPLRMAQLDESRALVEREEALHPVAELVGDMAGVIRERLGGVAGFPAAAILQRLRQVPVIKRRERRDAVGDELVEQAIVEVEPLRIGRAGALRKYSRPRDREPIGGHAERLHRLHVVLVAMIVIGGDVAGVVVADLSRRVRERVPDRGAAAIRVRRHLRSDTRRWPCPREIRWESRARSRGAAAVSSPGCAPAETAAAEAPSAPAPATFARSRRVNRVRMGASSIGLRSPVTSWDLQASGVQQD